MRTQSLTAASLVTAVILLATPLAAQTALGDQPAVIRVSGSGQVQASPDVAHVSFAVETFAETAREAGERNARQMNEVLAALRQAGAAEADIETSGYGVHPVYDHRQPQPRPGAGEPAEDPRITGYRAVNQVSVEIRDLDAVGRSIDAGLAAGANRLAGVRFELRDDQDARDEALRRAVARARSSAETLADALGVQLGPVRVASTQVESPGIFRAQAVRMEAAMADAPTPISPADQTVGATVELEFSIR